MIKVIATLSEAYGIAWRFNRQNEQVVLVLDIDDTLLFDSVDKYSGAPKLTETATPGELAYLTEQESCHVLILTARDEKYRHETELQLKELKIPYHTLLHAPNNEVVSGKKTSTKGAVLHAYLLGDGRKKWSEKSTIVVVDDLENNLLSMQASLSAREFEGLQPHFLKYVPDLRVSFFPDRSCDVNFPINLKGYSNPVSLGGGSNSVYQVTAKDGQQLVIKYGDNRDAIKVEIIMNALYRALGVQVPDSMTYRAIPPELAKAIGLIDAAVIVQCSEKLTSLRQATDDDVRTAFLEHFVVQCLLGNTDSAKRDNWIVTIKGVVLVDAGANYLFKALGDKKEKDNAGAVDELDSFRNQAVNGVSATWLEGITKDRIHQQALAVLAKSEMIERIIWTYSKKLDLSADLQSYLIALMASRLENLAMRTVGIDCIKPPRYREVAEHTSAGVLTVRQSDKGELEAFLGKRVRHPWYACLGGKSDSEDADLAQTAIREIREESGGQLGYTERELSKSPFQDIWTPGPSGQWKLYRLYVVYTENLLLDISGITDREHTDFCWVPLQSLIFAVEKKQSAVVENRPTLWVQVDTPSGSANLPLMPEFASLIQLRDMQVLLQQLVATRKYPWLSGCQSQRDLHPSVTFQPENRTRSIFCPVEFRRQAITSLVNHSRIQKELKRKQEPSGLYPQGSSSVVHNNDFVSQSELHLRVLLGKDYKPGDPKENIRQFIWTHHNSLTDEEKEKLIDFSTKMISKEKKYPDKIFFYHSCPAVIGYVYQIYSTIYQILYADPCRFVMRVENDMFHRLLNINEFISHFQALSGQKYDNYAPGYMELAISGNLFVFGNHNIPSSYSVSYMMNNESRAKIDFEKMLSEMLIGFNCKLTLIAEINQALAELAALNKQGVMYQFPLSRPEAEKYAYVAGSVGVLNRHRELDTLDPSHTINYLTNKLSQGTLTSEDCEYLTHLQVRVMLPPTLSVRDTQVIGWLPEPDSCQSIKVRLQKLSRVVAASILVDDGSGLHNQTVLNRQMRWIFPLTQPSDQRKKNVFQELKTLVEQKAYDELKERVIGCTFLVQYDVFVFRNSYSSAHIGEGAESLLLLLLRTELSVDLTAAIKNIYGEKFYLDERNAIALNQVDFKIVCEHIPWTDQLDFAISKMARISCKDIYLKLFDRMREAKRVDADIQEFLVHHIARLPLKEEVISQVIDRLKVSQVDLTVFSDGAELLSAIDSVYRKDEASSLMDSFGLEMVERGYITETRLLQDLTRIRYINTYALYLRKLLDIEANDQVIDAYLSRYACSCLFDPGYLPSGISALNRVLNLLSKYKKSFLLHCKAFSLWSAMNWTMFFSVSGQSLLWRHLQQLRCFFGEKFWENKQGFEAIKSIRLHFLFEQIDSKYYVELLVLYLKHDRNDDLLSTEVLEKLLSSNSHFSGLSDIVIKNNRLVNRYNYQGIIRLLIKHEPAKYLLEFIEIHIDLITRGRDLWTIFQNNIKPFFSKTPLEVSLHDRLEDFIIKVAQLSTDRSVSKEIRYYMDIANCNISECLLSTNLLLLRIKAIWDCSDLTLGNRYDLLNIGVKFRLSREKVLCLITDKAELVNPDVHAMDLLMQDFRTQRFSLCTSCLATMEDDFLTLLFLTGVRSSLPRTNDYNHTSKCRFEKLLVFSSKMSLVFKEAFLYWIQDRKHEPDFVLTAMLNLYSEALKQRIPYRDRNNVLKLNLFYRNTCLQIKAIRSYLASRENGVGLSRAQVALLKQGTLAEVLSGFESACNHLNRRSQQVEENEIGGGSSASCQRVI
jgi:8-oxo-dGTP pyrophosphatase MutT (NUDIX family)